MELARNIMAYTSTYFPGLTIFFPTSPISESSVELDWVLLAEECLFFEW